jgi:hypothetical protein
MMMMVVVVVINVQLIGFWTFVIISLRMFLSSLSLSITEPYRATALIPVRLAYDHFVDNTLLSLDDFLESQIR